MLKSKRVKVFLPFVIFLFVISIYFPKASFSAASDLSADFKQLNYAQLLSDMDTGWNLGNTLEASIDGKPYETAWGNPVVTKEFITKIKDTGFKSIRIPVSYLKRIGSGPDYTIEAEWLNRIQEVVDYAISQDMYVMINMHGDGYKSVTGSWLIVDSTDQEAIRVKYKKVWEQIANKFKNYNEHLIFESMNEEFDGTYSNPNATYYANLNAYNQIFVDTVRQTGGNNSARWLLIPGWNTNIDYTTGDFGFVIPNDNYRSATIPSAEKRLAISVHYYSPWEFCGAESGTTTQWGASATDPDKTLSWCQEDYMESQFNAMYKKFSSQGYPFIVGEYGAVDKTKADPQSNTYRQIFDKALCSTVKKYGGVPVYWDNGHNGDYGFAIFDRKAGLVSQQGIVDAIMEAEKTTPDFDPKVPPIVITPTPVPDGSFVVTYESNGGSTVNMTIKNLLNRNIDWWTLEFTFPGDQKILDIWGGKATQNGSSVVITNADWNGKIKANGGSITLGFNVSYTGKNESPKVFKVNGSSTISNATPAPTPTPSPTPTPTPILSVKYGDVDQDGSITALDSAVLKQNLLGKRTLEGNEAKVADVDGDKEVTAFDLIYIQKYLLGKISYEDFPAVGGAASTITG